MKIATVFSGIGAVEQALEKMRIKYEIIFACDNGEIRLDEEKNSYNSLISELKKLNIEKPKEIQKFIKRKYKETKKINHVKQTYFKNYKITEDRWHEDIRFLNGREYNQNIDILVGGSPCQSFSVIGKRGGLEDTRGTLFYDFARLIKETKPRNFIYENVTGLLSHDKGKTWEIIKNVFNTLGYKWEMRILNAKDFSLPHNRRRVFVVGSRDGNVEFPNPVELKTTVSDYLDDTVPTKRYLGKKGFEFVTNKKYKNRARVNKDIIMCQKANQQFNWNGDFIFEKLDSKKHNKEILDRAYVGEFNNQKGVIRQLSHRECHRLMGFSDEFKITPHNVHAYRQSGNSIAVTVLEALIKKIIESWD